MATREAERARMLTADEAAAQLGVKLGTLYAYVSRGWLRSYRRRIGRQALYRRDDIDALRDLATAEGGRRGRSLPDASSWVTVAQLPSSDGSTYGVIVAESAVSSIIEGRLAYRGYPVEELIARASFEEVCLLLWEGKRPLPGALAALRQAIARTEAPERVIAALRAVGEDASPLLRLEVVMPALASLERHRGTRPTVEQGTRIMSLLPLALARGSSGFNGAGAGGAGMAARLANVALHAPAAEWEIATLDRILVACAEHELNASTFAARVVASTGADLYASVLSALCSLSGPIHGGACDRIEQMFAQLDAGVRLEDCLAAFSVKWRLPPGFGHAIYPSGDPRAVLLKKEAAEIARRRGRRLFETALRVEETVWRRERLRPNLDFYLTVCARMLGFARGLPAAIFAVGRAAGWIAHSLEQYADNRLIRPRMRYRGVPMRHWT
ncbi:MAG TPA: citrate/2-methylcitrate synthase [Candidatus Binataceae bacterium]